MTLTKKHFNKIAGILNRSIVNKGTPKPEINLIENGIFLNAMCKYFKTENPKFNTEKFKEACLK